MPAMSIAIASKNRSIIHKSMIKYKIEIKQKENRKKMNIFQRVRYYRNRQNTTS